MKTIAVLQPEVPHYRKEFFERLQKNFKVLDIYLYNAIEDTKKQGFHIPTIKTNYIKNKKMFGLLFYKISNLLCDKYDTLILMLQISHISTWLILLTKFIHKKHVVLWGQGISVKRYLKEEKTPDWKLKLMIYLSDGIMLYTDKEALMWKSILPPKKIISLNNSLTGATEIINYISVKSKEQLKKEYKIKQKILLIFCARFESNYRRVDLLIETIKKLNKSKYGFIIIGDGKNKPDFSTFSNVHDFGAVYDDSIKRDLFNIADIYFQPGWVGLSIVEAMAYGKPVFTFKRTEETKQCVEYGYLINGENSMIFENIDECISKIESISDNEINRMGNNARYLVKNKLTPKKMSDSTIALLEQL